VTVIVSCKPIKGFQLTKHIAKAMMN